MALVFQRRLAIPLWAIALLTLALTTPPSGTLFLMPPTTVFAIAAIGVAAIVLLRPGAIPWLRTSRALVRVLPSGHRDQPSAAITLAAATRVCTLDESNRSTADALDLVRMDDDGGWQMP
jgi:hypothetical protein